MKEVKHSLESRVAGLNEAIDSIPDKIEAMLDRRSMIDQLSLDQFARAVEQGPCLQAMANDISALRRMLATSSRADSAPGDGTAGGEAGPSECPRMVTLLKISFSHDFIQPITSVYYVNTDMHLMVSRDAFLLVGGFLLSYPYQLCTSTGTVATKVITFLQ